VHFIPLLCANLYIMKKVFIQVIKEFWIQFVISIFWGLFRIEWTFSQQDSIINFIGNFGAAFFLTSWFLGQILRIKKQQKIESHFEVLTTHLQNLIIDLKTTSKNIIDNVTGGESFLYMVIGSISKDNEFGQITFIHQGENPVYDVSVEYLDLNVPKGPNGDFVRNRLSIGTQPPKTASSGPTIKLDKSKGMSFSVFFTTRSGLVNQGINMKFENERWHQACQVSNFDKVLMVKIPDDFPENDDKQIKMWKKTKAEELSA